MTYSHMGNATLPSALVCFTSEFGMGSGGSRPLWSSGKTDDHWGTRWNVMLISFERGFRVALRYPQLSWVLYSQAARAISTG